MEQKFAEESLLKREISFHPQFPLALKLPWSFPLLSDPDMTEDSATRSAALVSTGSALSAGAWLKRHQVEVLGKFRRTVRLTSPTKTLVSATRIPVARTLAPVLCARERESELVEITLGPPRVKRKLTPKTIGNRKRDCAWGGSGW